MGKKKLYTGILLGAVIGGLTSLFNSDVRHYAKKKLTMAKSVSNYYVKNPSAAIRNLKHTLDQFDRNMSSGIENSLNALEQIENTLEQIGYKESDRDKLID